MIRLQWMTMAALIAALTGPAAAAESSAEAVQARVIEGQQYFKAGDYRRALATFVAVAEAHPPAARDPRLQWNIARCHEELGAFEKAIPAFELTARLSDAEGRRARASAKATALRARYFGSVDVACAEGARVRIEGLAGELPCPARWGLARAGGYQGTLIDGAGRRAPFEVEVVAGAAARIEVAMTMGDAEVDCDPGATARLAGLADEQPCPARWASIPAGRYAGELRGAGGEARAFDLEVPPGDVARVRVALPEASGGSPWPWVSGGVGLAAVGAAVWFKLDGAAAREAAGDADAPADFDAEQDRFERDEVGYYASLGIGLGLVALGAALFVFDGEPDPSVVGRATGAGWGWTW